LAQTKNVYLAK